MDLGQEILVAVVVVDPFSDIIKKIKGDVDGTCLALDLVSQVPGGVQFGVGGAAAGRATAAFVDFGQGGSQQRWGAAQPSQPSLQLRPDQRWVIRHAHNLFLQGLLASRWYGSRLTKNQSEINGAKKEISRQ
jgi:hypothetical protein